MTQLMLDSPQLAALKSTEVLPESIESAAPDLLKKVMPSLLKWCERYHQEHDTRYAWTLPQDRPEGRELSDKQQLLWDLEDNMSTSLAEGSEKNAAEVLRNYVLEPDEGLDGNLSRPPYLERLRPSMSYFFEGDRPETEAFRHYYVPSSLFPPIITPRGIAPYRADLYAHLARGAFATGHPYWGFRFLAWSIHYVQDVTQPWHTLFLPNASFLKWSRSEMRHDVSALHYITEAFADSWLERSSITPSLSSRSLAQASTEDTWFVSHLVEKLARAAHEKADEITGMARKLFAPIVGQLDLHLHPEVASLVMGGVVFPTAHLDFTGKGEGATAFLAPIWSPAFNLKGERDEFASALAQQIDAALEGSHQVVEYALSGAGEKLPRLF